jgi:hypothetical protein
MGLYKGQKVEQRKFTVMTSFRSSGLEREYAFRESFTEHHIGLRRRKSMFTAGTRAVCPWQQYVCRRNLCSVPMATVCFPQGPLQYVHGNSMFPAGTRAVCS